MGKIGYLSCFNAFEIHCLQNKRNGRLIRKTTLNSINNKVEQYVPHLQLFFLPSKFLTLLPELKLQVYLPGQCSVSAVSFPSAPHPRPQMPVLIRFCEIQQHLTSTSFLSFILQCFLYNVQVFPSL